MKIYKELIFNEKKSQRSIFFGEVDTDEEKEGVFKLRFDVYTERNYIDPKNYNDNLDIDDYDRDSKCRYFITQTDGETIGAIRLIQCNPLPTEKFFSFDPPREIVQIATKDLCEFSRFVIIPPRRMNGRYLPRGLVMLFMFDMLVSYCNNNRIEGGYAFVKNSLLTKLKKFKVPVKLIQNFSLRYPSEGPLKKYFDDVGDAVFPIYFITESVGRYLHSLLFNSKLFQTIDDKRVLLRENIYVRFLRGLKII